PEFFIKNIKDFYWINYDWLVPRICEFVDKDRLHIGVMEKASVSNTTQDFFRFLGVDESSLVNEEPKNESLTKGQLDIARRVGLLALKPKGRQKVLSSIKKINIDEDDGSKIVFTPEQREGILESFQDGNKKLANDFLGKRKLFEEEVVFSDPVLVPEKKIYEVYMPELLKLVVES
ncbi:hypothetical protein, partial [Halomonas caseinilytica]